jgi:hypothetical protein
MQDNYTLLMQYFFNGQVKPFYHSLRLFLEVLGLDRELICYGGFGGCRPNRCI